MRRIKRANGAVDYVFTAKEFSKYAVGCVMKVNKTHWTVGVKGDVPDLKNIVISKDALKKKRKGVRG